MAEEKLGTCRNPWHDDFGLHREDKNCGDWREQPAQGEPIPSPKLPDATYSYVIPEAHPEGGEGEPPHVCHDCEDIVGGDEGMSAEQFWPKWASGESVKLMPRDAIQFAEAYAALKTREAERMPRPRKSQLCQAPPAPTWP